MILAWECGRAGPGVEDRPDEESRLSTCHRVRNDRDGHLAPRSAGAPAINRCRQTSIRLRDLGIDRHVRVYSGDLLAVFGVGVLRKRQDCCLWRLPAVVCGDTLWQRAGTGR